MPALISSMSRKAASGHQYLVKMAQFSIDVRLIGDCTAHLCSQRFTESLTKSRKPGSQSRYWYFESSRGFLLTRWLGTAAGHKWPQFFKPLSLAFCFKF